MKSIRWQDYILRDPQILFGKPCIKGTRIPVELILEKLNFGWTYSDLLDAYPRIKEADILACIEFGEKMM